MSSVCFAVGVVRALHCVCVCVCVSHESVSSVVLTLLHVCLFGLVTLATQ